MKKFTTFFAIATVVVALSSCGSKTAETTEATDSVATEVMEAAPAVEAVVDTAAAMVDTATAH